MLKPAKHSEVRALDVDFQHVDPFELLLADETVAPHDTLLSPYGGQRVRVVVDRREPVVTGVMLDAHLAVSVQEPAFDDDGIRDRQAKGLPGRLGDLAAID